VLPKPKILQGPLGLIRLPWKTGTSGSLHVPCNEYQMAAEHRSPWGPCAPDLRLRNLRFFERKFDFFLNKQVL
jgi:hypothetical protein